MLWCGRFNVSNQLPSCVTFRYNLWWKSSAQNRCIFYQLKNLSPPGSFMFLLCRTWWSQNNFQPQSHPISLGPCKKGGTDSPIHAPSIELPMMTQRRIPAPPWPRSKNSWRNQAVTPPATADTPCYAATPWHAMLGDDIMISYLYIYNYIYICIFMDITCTQRETRKCGNDWKCASVYCGYCLYCSLDV